MTATTQLLVQFASELLIQILYHLDLQDLLNSRLWSRRFNALVIESIPLQYRIECLVAGVIDNPSCVLPISKRLDILKRHQEPWEYTTSADDLGSHKMVEVPRPFQQKSLGSLSIMGADGTIGCWWHGYDEGDGASETLCTLLPEKDTNGSRPTPRRENWESRSFEGLATWTVPRNMSSENDLLLKINFSFPNQAETPNSVFYICSINFTQLSTGFDHPKATNPHVTFRAKCGHVRYVLDPKVEIYGAHVGILINLAKSSAFLHVHNWQTGEQALSVRLLCFEYGSFCFLREDLILLLNEAKWKFEFWHVERVSGTNTEHSPFFTLDLPHFMRNNIIPMKFCSMNRGNQRKECVVRPFYEDPAMGLICLNFRSDGGPHTFVARYCDLLSLLPQQSCHLDNDTDSVRSLAWDKWGPRTFNLVHVGGTLPTIQTILSPRFGFVRPYVLSSKVYVREYNPLKIRRLLSQGSLPSGLVVRLGDETEPKTYSRRGQTIRGKLKSEVAYLEYALPGEYEADAVVVNQDGIYAFKAIEHGSTDHLFMTNLLQFFC